MYDKKINHTTIFFVLFALAFNITFANNQENIDDYIKHALLASIEKTQDSISSIFSEFFNLSQNKNQSYIHIKIKEDPIYTTRASSKDARINKTNPTQTRDNFYNKNKNKKLSQNNSKKQQTQKTSLKQDREQQVIIKNYYNYKTEYIQDPELNNKLAQLESANNAIKDRIDQLDTKLDNTQNNTNSFAKIISQSQRIDKLYNTKIYNHHNKWW